MTVGFTILVRSHRHCLVSRPGLDLTFSAAVGTANVSGDASCIVAVANGGDGIDVGFADAEPGDRCQFTVAVDNNGTTDAAVQDLVSPDFSGGDVTAGVVSCGARSRPQLSTSLRA